MMSTPDCYFFVDQSVPEEDQTVSPLCVECHDSKMPEVGWFYKGSVEGYGPFEYKCRVCGKVIYAGEEGINVQEENQATGEDPRR